MDWKLELVAVPVSDVDRARDFYADKVGFKLDHDHTVNDELRFVQLTPPGSACSITIGTGVVDTPPGSVHGLQLVVADIEAARRELVDRGVEVTEVQTFPGGAFVFFSDPDGNRWAVQAIPARDAAHPGPCRAGAQVRVLRGDPSRHGRGVGAALAVHRQRRLDIGALRWRARPSWCSGAVGLAGASGSSAIVAGARSPRSTRPASSSATG